ncbi:MAG TPA: PAS domain S-box protein [Thermoanaerobaculia bacterium]|nr:PAS domain S-box protein [Thermoanaerobaculia bacterium]
MRLLFVEDSLDDIELITAYLHRHGFEFEQRHVDTLDGLVHALKTESWSAVISDYNMPGFDGLQTLGVVRAHSRELPFLLVSGHVGEERAVDAIRSGANDFVSKDRLARLGPALERELRDVHLREEHRAIFEAYRRSEDRYRRIFEGAPIGIGISTATGELFTINERLLAILGYKREELTGRRLSEFLLPGSEPVNVPAVQVEQQFVRRDGTILRASVTVSPTTTDDLAIDQLVWLVEDITARALHEEQLLSQRAQLAEAQRMAHVGSYEYDLLTGERTWSDELYRIYGLDPALGPDVDTAEARVHPDDRERVIATGKKVREEGVPFTTEHRILLPNGETRHLRSHGRFIRDEKGQPVKSLGAVQDVTERRLQEQELQRRAVQQVVVANLGQAALSGEPIEAVLGQAADLVVQLLDVELCGILKHEGARFRVAGGSGWIADITEGVDLDPSMTTMATYTVETGAPVVVDNLLAEKRFAPPMLLLRQGVVSGVSVPISTGRLAPWGVLGALSRTMRTFTTADIDFLRSIATVLAQAFERDRVDRQLVLHAAQQSAIAELSRIALKSVEHALDIVCDIVSGVLEIDDTRYYELRPETRTLQYRGSSSSRPISLDDENSPIASCLWKAGPVLIEHDPSDDYVLGVAVPVSGSSGNFGVLATHALRKRHEVGADAEFMQSLANIIADAQERERATQALALSEERYREVIEGASEIIFTLTTDGRFSALNEAFRHVTGHSWQAAIGRRFADFLHPDDLEKGAAAFRTIVCDRRSLRTELRLLGRNGVVLLDITSHPKVADERTVVVHGFARDITETRRAETERERLTRNLQLLLESTVEGIITTDLDGRCTLWNSAAINTLGRDHIDMHGMDVQQLLFGDAAAGEPSIAAVAKSGEVRAIAHGMFQRSDGTQVPVEYSAAPVIDNGVPIGVVISFSDVTERQRLEMKLEQADRLTSLGRLAATIAHEFNNVLMGISPFIEVIRRGRNNTDVALDHIGRAVKRGKRITEDILRFTQPAQPVRTAFDVARWIENIGLEARTLLPPSCRLEVEVQPSLRVNGDSTQLQQIFTNLVLNARDAMPFGGTVVIDVRREAPDARLPFGSIEHPDRYAHFTVRDTGCGMTAETLRHIFEPLFTTKKNGTGLGLPVAHQVVQRHDGEIFVESTPGQGTSFHIFLPLALEAEIHAAEVMTNGAPMAITHRVLLVEDDRTVATGIATLLELEGLYVEVAESGAQAIRAVERNMPDVVVLDVGLPDMEGPSVYNAIAATRPELPVIFSTGHGDRAKLEAFLEKPHVAYLLKPYESSALLGAIREVMG